MLARINMEIHDLTSKLLDFGSAAPQHPAVLRIKRRLDVLMRVRMGLPISDKKQNNTKLAAKKRSPLFSSKASCPERERLRKYKSALRSATRKEKLRWLQKARSDAEREFVQEFFSFTSKVQKLDESVASAWSEMVKANVVYNIFYAYVC